MLGYGGQAGGGKSALQLIASTTGHKNAIIFRRLYQPSLAGLIKDSHKLLDGSPAHFNRQDKEWKNIPGDRVLQFGYMKSDSDKENWRGNPHDYKGIDEVTEFTFEQFQFLTGWLRSPIPHQRCRVVVTFNPPSKPEGKWVIDYFAPWLDPNYEERTGRPRAQPAELRWFVGQGGKDIEIDPPTEFYVGDRVFDSPDRVQIEREWYWPRPKPIEMWDDRGERWETLEPRSRTFIPASLDDNPSLKNSGYRGQLQLLPEPLRSQLLYGDFTIEPEDDRWQVIPSEWLQKANERYRIYEQEGVLRSLPLSHIGADVAQGGQDLSVLAIRRDYIIELLAIKEGRDTPDGDSYLRFIVETLQSLNELYPLSASINFGDLSKKYIQIDGMPNSPLHTLRTSQHPNAQTLRKNKFIPVAMTGSAAAKDEGGKPICDRSERLVFANRRTWWAWNLRELLNPKSNVPIAIPFDGKLNEELLALRYRQTERKVEVEISPSLHQWELEKYEIALTPKEKLVEQLGRSPDRADALCMACADMPHYFGIF